MNLNEVESNDRFLSDEDKLLILIVASVLFLITLIATVCFVSPCCWPNKLLARLISLFDTKQSDKPADKPGKQRQVVLESKNFQLTVQPQFVGKSNGKKNSNTSNQHESQSALCLSPIIAAATVASATPTLINDKKQLMDSSKLINLYRPETEQELKIQKKMLKQLFKQKELNDNPFTINHKELIDYDYYTARTLSTRSKICLLVEEHLYDEINAELAMDLSIELINDNAGSVAYSQSPIAKKLLNGDLINLNGLTNGEKDSLVCVQVHMRQLNNLKASSCGPDLAVFLTLNAQVVNSHFRKSSARKQSQKLNNSLSFESLTFKVRSDPIMIDAQYQSDAILRSLVKDSKLKVKLMQNTRYANDRCLGEFSLNLKRFLSDCDSFDLTESVGNNELSNKSTENDYTNNCFKFNKPKDVKGDLVFGTCYLPTSKRISFIVVKASFYGQLNSGKNYYVRILLFVNNKVVKKKKTSTSERLVWPENETITFDLGSFDENRDQLSFMIVLSSTNQHLPSAISSPSSPGSPSDNDTDNANQASDRHSSKNDRHIGHFLIGNQFWEELRLNPRKQIIRLARLH